MSPGRLLEMAQLLNFPRVRLRAAIYIPAGLASWVGFVGRVEAVLADAQEAERELKALLAVHDTHRDALATKLVGDEPA